MTLSNVVYKSGTADVQSILTHLNACKDNFIPALDKTVDIASYSKKIAENCITFEAWVSNKLAGLIAAYFNDPENTSGFITNVSVLKIYAGRGFASELLKNCIDYGVENKFKEISLEVENQNERAIRLYKKMGFYQSATKNNLLILKKIL
jgi:ribosomal protein S18 acetylase RimI-like enzyme